MKKQYKMIRDTKGERGTRKGICAECGKSLFIDSEGNSEYDFYQHRKYSTMNYKIDYHFCSQSCMQKKIGKQPLSNIQAKAEGYKQGQAETAKQIFKELEGYIYIFKGNIAFNLNRKEYEAIKKKYKIEE